MTTKNVITGSQVTLTIDDKDGNPVDYTPQVLGVTLTSAADRQAIDLLNGSVFYKTTVREYELAITGLADWGHSDSVCDALEAAFADDPDAPLDFELVAINDPNTITVSGKVFPKVPVAGGTGAEVTQFDVTLTGDVNAALSITSAATPS
jgi:hypothetical protein